MEFSTRTCGERTKSAEEDRSVSLGLGSSVVVTWSAVVPWELEDVGVDGTLLDGEESESESDELERELVEEGLLELDIDDDGFGASGFDAPGLGSSADDGAGVGVGEGDEEGELLGAFPPPPAEELPPEPLASKTTKFALLPFGTVTTQKAAPSPLIVGLPDIWLTLCLAGSTPQGRPLHPPPSQTISTPQFGISSRNGVSFSR